ncbi:glycolate oxidase subunit GlcF [Rhodospirillaceae bacterium AH-315-P19]|nr:glycolate oxidase subunit GlcF [Rhodospirillaceae bacterium AH-315-P19]
MQTAFTLAQLADPDVAEANRILRSCIHCGMCLASCPTYVLSGDERDSPRGRIYLIKELLEKDAPPSATCVRHLDRCLGCMACVTACPSGVDYEGLLARGRARIAAAAVRPFSERLWRGFLGRVLPWPGRFRALLRLSRLGRPWLVHLPGRLGRAVAHVPRRMALRADLAGPGVHEAKGERRRRVLLLEGCVQKSLRPAIHDASVRLLTRLGCEVVVVKGVGCCGATLLHLGDAPGAKALARTNLDCWMAAIGESDDAGEAYDAIVINAAGCGTMVKDYANLFRDDPAYLEKAARVSALAKDISEIMETLGVAPSHAVPAGFTVAYQSACGLHYGQGIGDLPFRLLEQAGFAVVGLADPELCCGSAGPYSLLQPDFAEGLRARKLDAIADVKADVVATGNIGCRDWLAGGSALPFVHVVELLDWASGGPKPAEMDAVPDG